MHSPTQAFNGGVQYMSLIIPCPSSLFWCPVAADLWTIFLSFQKQEKPLIFKFSMQLHARPKTCGGLGSLLNPNRLTFMRYGAACDLFLTPTLCMAVVVNSVLLRTSTHNTDTDYCWLLYAHDIAVKLFLSWHASFSSVFVCRTLEKRVLWRKQTSDPAPSKRIDGRRLIVISSQFPIRISGTPHHKRWGGWGPRVQTFPISTRVAYSLRSVMHQHSSLTLNLCIIWVDHVKSVPADCFSDRLLPLQGAFDHRAILGKHQNVRRRSVWSLNGSLDVCKPALTWPLPKGTATTVAYQRLLPRCPQRPDQVSRQSHF